MNQRLNINSIFNHLCIKHKLLALYILGFFLPTLIIAFFLSIWIYKTLNKWQLKQASSASDQTKTLLEAMLFNAEKLSESLFVNNQVRTIMAKQYYSSADIYNDYSTLSFLPGFLRSNKDILSFRYYAENQTLIDSAYFIRIGPKIVFTPWYQEAVSLQGKAFWIIKEDPVSKITTLSLVRSMLDYKTGKPLGVLSVYIDPQKIRNILKNNTGETLISVNNDIYFSSSEKHNRVNTLTPENLSQGESSVSKAEWNQTKVIILSSCLLKKNNNTIVIKQIIPLKDLTTETIRGLLICISIIVAASIISITALMFFYSYFTHRISYINSQIKKVVQNNFALGPRLAGNDELAQIYDSLTQASDTIKTLIQEVYQNKLEQEQLLARQNDIRFKMLSSQINPHFLFNTLETIRMLSLNEGNKKTALTIRILASLLRHNLSAMNKPISMVNEIQAVDNYLSIQHLRFGKRISYDIMFLTDIRLTEILPLLIQPLVENSFCHGLENRDEGGFIYILINSDEKNNDLIITIEDNGIGMSEEKLNEVRTRLKENTVENFSNSIGMINVNQRIKLYYGQSYGLTVDSKINKGTVVTIRLPFTLTGEGGIKR